MKELQPRWLSPNCTILQPSEHQEWLDARKGTIGGSEVSSVMGLSPFCTPYQLWQRKKAEIMGLDTEMDSIAMEMGHYLEPMVAERWQNASGLQIIKNTSPDWIAHNSKYPFAHVSPDRLFYVGKRGGERGLLEIKTTKNGQFNINDNVDRSFIMYLTQIQWGLGIMEMEMGSLAVLQYGFTEAFSFRHIVFSRNFFDKCLEMVDRFVNYHLKQDIPPDAISVRDILDQFPDINPDDMVEASQDAVKDCANLAKVNEQIRTLKSVKEGLEESIKLEMGKHAILTHGDDILATWKMTNSDKPQRRFSLKK